MLDSPPTALLAKEDPDMIKSKVDEAREWRQQLVSKLENVLSKNRPATLSALREIYGLGTYRPSYFAIYTVGELHLSEACSDLNKPHLKEINGERLAAQIRAVKEHVCATP